MAATAERQLTPQLRYAIVSNAAKKYHIPAEYLWGVSGLETNYGQNVKSSSANAEGAFQFLQTTAAAYHYPYTNRQNESIFTEQADAAAHYLSVLVRSSSGNWDKALKAYSGGGYGLKQVKEAGGHVAPGLKVLGPEEVSSATSAAGNILGPIGKELAEGLGGVVLKGVLLLAGAVLVVYGIMVAVRPRESAFSVPTPKVLPLPV